MDINILGSLTIVGVQEVQNIGLDTAFRNNIMPIFYEVGKIIAYVSVTYGAYYLIRMKYAEGANRIKWAAVGYICLRLTEDFIDLVDSIANNINF